MSIESLRAALSDRYTIERELGAGGMATVYLAHDLKHDRQVAVKVLKPELGAVIGAERFLSEIRVTASLQHPNLLPLFDSGEANGLLYYVMPYIEGETLRTRIDRERQFPVAEVMQLLQLLAGALDFAHSRGVIHRDLKPENILLQAGQPVIADLVSRSTSRCCTWDLARRRRRSPTWSRLSRRIHSSSDGSASMRCMTRFAANPALSPCCRS